MKKEELAAMIRTIVQEEVEKSLSEVMVEILYSKARKDVIKEKKVSEGPVPLALALPKRTPVVGWEGGPPGAPPRPQKKFSSNPVLNQILNETEGGIPPDNAVAPLTSVLDTIQAATPQQLNENTAVAAVAGALTRDYRSLVKAIDSKASRVSPPPKDFFK